MVLVMWSGTSYLWFTNLVGISYTLRTNRRHLGKRFWQSSLPELLHLQLKNQTSQDPNQYQPQLIRFLCHHLFLLKQPRKSTSYQNTSKTKIPRTITNPRTNQKRPNPMPRSLNHTSIQLKS